MYMPRARNIKPAFFKNEFLAELPAEARLLFIGLWTLADREGRLEDRPKRIKIEIFPCDNFDIDDLLSQLNKASFIIRYKADDINYIQIINFTKHQMPHHKEVASIIPAPDGHKQITRHSYEVSNQTRKIVFDRDNNSCLKCNIKDGLSIDHIKPLAKGGDNSIGNLQTLCAKCNSSKGDAAKDYRKVNIESTLSQQQVNVDASCPSDSLILNPESLLLNPDIIIPERGIEALSIFKNKILNEEMKKFAEDKGVFGKQLEISWQRFLIKKGNTMIERKCNYEQFFADWQLWILNERVEDTPQSEEKVLTGEDLKIQHLGSAAWRRKNKMSLNPEQKRFLEDYEAANGNVWWESLRQFKAGR